MRFVLLALCFGIQTLPLGAKPIQRKTAGETKSCAEVARIQAKNGYKNADLSFVTQMRWLEIINSTCVDESKSKLEGWVYPNKIDRMFVLQPFDCSNISVKPSDLAAPIAFKKEFGASFNEITNRTNQNIKSQYALVPTKEDLKAMNNQIKKENQIFFSKFNQLLTMKEADAQPYIQEHSEVICYQETEEEIRKLETMNDCAIPSVNHPKFSKPSSGPSRKLSQISKGYALMMSLEAIIRSGDSCEAKTSSIKKLFSNSVVNDLDDLIYLTYVSNNLNFILNTPPLRATLASAMKGEAQLEPFCNNRLNECMKLDSSMFELRNLTIGETLTALKSEGADGYDYFSTLSNDSQRKVVEKVLESITSAIKDRKLLASKSKQFQEICDKTIADYMGDGTAVATASGYELQRKSAYLTEQGQQCKSSQAGCKKRLIPGAEYDLGGYDAFSRMHLYPDANLSNDVSKPFYAPPGWSSAGPGGKASTAGSYILNYPRFGRYRNIIFNPNHLGSPHILLNGGKSSPRNKHGWIQIGTIGGKGGGGVEDGKSKDQNESRYVHSHLQILGGGGLLNFQDAFCKGKAGP